MVDAVLYFEGDARPPLPHPARGQEPLRPDRRDRRVRDVRRAACARSPTRPSCSSASATPTRRARRCSPAWRARGRCWSRSRRWSRRRSLGTPRRAVVGWDRAAALDGARGARGALRRAASARTTSISTSPAACDHRAGRRPRGGGGAGLVAHRLAAARRTASISAKSAFRARSGRSRMRGSGSRKRQSSGFAGACCRRRGEEPASAPIGGRRLSSHIADLVAGIAAMRTARRQRRTAARRTAVTSPLDAMQRCASA